MSTLDEMYIDELEELIRKIEICLQAGEGVGVEYYLSKFDPTKELVQLLQRILAKD